MTNIAFVSSEKPEAKNSLKVLKRIYTNVSPDKADVIVALGGDGTILKLSLIHISEAHET